jgi:hypothetical protein
MRAWKFLLPLVVALGGALPCAVLAQDSPAANAPAAPPPSVPLGVASSMGFPDSVPMNAMPPADMGRGQQVIVQYELSNLANATVTLKADSPCQSHSWSVTDATGAIVEQQPACLQVLQPVTLDVPVGKPLDTRDMITLHVFNYIAGVTYTFHDNYWGLASTATFTVQLLNATSPASAAH